MRSSRNDTTVERKVNSKSKNCQKDTTVAGKKNSK